MKNHKVLVLGSNGMAGHLIKEYLSNNSKLELLGINDEYFLSSKNNYLKKIERMSPDIIINSLRITVNECDNNPKSGILINSVIPKNLESFYYYSKVKIIHLSTDCVFSGEKGNYSENDTPDGRTIYSMTKLCGEIINAKDLTIRTSYIGPNLKNKNEELFDWFLHQKEDIEGYEGSIWNGVTTLELAKKIEQSIINNYCGIYHLCSKEKLSKYKLLTLIQKQWGKNDIYIKKIQGQQINRTLKDNRSNISVSNYKQMFKELYNFMKQKRNIYGHYNIFKG